MKTTLVPKKCPWCGNFFNPKTAWTVFCSQDCLKQSDRKKGKERREKERLKKIAASIADDQAYLTVRQAVAIFAVNRITLYTHIRHGIIPVVRIKERGIRIKRTELESRYLTREKQAHSDPLPPRVKLYNLEPENCYTIGEATEKFKVGSTFIYNNVRKYSIPMRQIGRFVYIPKEEIDRIFENR